MTSTVRLSTTTGKLLQGVNTALHADEPILAEITTPGALSMIITNRRIFLVRTSGYYAQVPKFWETSFQEVDCVDVQDFRVLKDPYVFLHVNCPKNTGCASLKFQIKKDAAYEEPGLGVDSRG